MYRLKAAGRSWLVYLVPVTLLGVVWLMDSLPVAQEGRVAIALVDEPAHLSTALIVLLAIGGPGLLSRHRTFSICATAGAVLIDLDHIPLYAGVPGISMPGGRPYSHSLATTVVLMLLACALPRARAVFVGLSCGTLLHFVRDVGTGPGLPLFWPFDDASQLVPYAAYFSLIAVLAGLATARLVAYFRASTPIAAAKGLASEAE